MTATLDGISKDRKTVVEIKNVNSEYHEMARNGIVPDVYIPQVFHQMEVAKPSTMIYWSYDRKEKKGHAVEVMPDSAYVAKLLKAEFEFQQMILDIEAPELTEYDFEDMEGDWIQVARELGSVTELLKPLESREKELREMLKKLSNNRNCKGGGYKFSTYMQPGADDYKKVPELNGVNLDLYRKAPFQKWRFSGMG